MTPKIQNPNRTPTAYILALVQLPESRARMQNPYTTLHDQRVLRILRHDGAVVVCAQTARVLEPQVFCQRKAENVTLVCFLRVD